MELNLKKAKEEKNQGGDFQPIPQNRYDFVIEAAREKVSKSSGNPMIEVTLRIDDGQDFSNRKLWDNFSLSEKAQIYLVKFLQAAGVDDLLQEEKVTTDEVCREVVGKKVSGFVKITTGGDKPRNEISDYTPAQGVSKKGTPAAGTAKSGGNKSKLFS